MRFKLVFLFLVSFLVFVIALIGRVDHILFSDKTAAVESQMRNQISPIAYSFSQTLSSHSSLINLGLKTYTGKKEFPSQSPLGEFEMIGELSSPSIKEWTFDQVIMNEKHKNKASLVQYLSLLLKNIDARDIAQEEYGIFTLLDQQRNPYLFVLENKTRQPGQRFQFYLIATDALQKYIEQNKNAYVNIFSVNQLGQALGHTISEYVGSQLSEDPIVQQIKNSPISKAFESYKNLKGESVFGFYEQVPKTNIFIVASQNTQHVFQGRSWLWLQLLLMGLGLSFIATGLLYLTAKNKEQVTTNLPTAQSLPQLDQHEEVTQDRRKEYLNFIHVLVLQLKNPISNILGYVQLQKTKPNEENLNLIESHARKLNETLDKLDVESSLKYLTSERDDITDVLQSVLKNINPLVHRKGVKIINQLQFSDKIEFPRNAVYKIIENILLNSIESMERMPSKEIKISGQNNHDEIEIFIEDSGEGIEKENLPKLLDPFFTTKSSREHSGLGLSEAFALVQALNGDLEISSTRQKGTTVKIKLKVIQELRSNKKLQSTLGVEKDKTTSSVESSTQIVATPQFNQMPEIFNSLEDQEVEKTLDFEALSWISNGNKNETIFNNENKKSQHIESFEKPNIKMKNKETQLANIEFSIRRPGDKI
jgi:signal transduction histidine kinase